MKIVTRFLVMVLILFLVLPTHALERSEYFRFSDPLEQTQKVTNEATMQAGSSELQLPSKQEIVEKWKNVHHASTVFASTPSVSAPYSSGALTKDYLKSGLSYLNYIRFIAGLPEVALDSSMNTNAQHGAVLLAAVNQLTHFPEQPSDMDDAFYAQGYNATTSSNLSCFWGYSNYQELLHLSLMGCMNDNSSLTNLTCVGHRRWLLNPDLGNVGFGYAQSQSGACFVVTKVFDWSGPGCDFNYISWPASGYHPNNMFSFLNSWSVTLNTNVYQYASTENVTVTLTRLSDGKRLVINSDSGDPSTATAPFMIVDHLGYGLPNCIIFRPDFAFFDYEGSECDAFEVKITGIHYADGTPTEIIYDVNFFDMYSALDTSTLQSPSLKLTNISSTGKPKLTWDAVPGATKYEVYRSTSKTGTYKRLSTVTGTSLTNSSAETGKTYYYKVRAISENGLKSRWSNIVIRTCVLPRPTITLSNKESTGKILVSWTAIEGAKKYEVYRSTDNKTWSKFYTTTGTSMTNTSAEAGQQYYYKVRAIHEKSAANSAYSPAKYRTCDLPRPTITLGNKASTGKIVVSWNAVAGAKKYEVYRSTDNVNWSKLYTTTATSMTNTGAEAGTQYYYKVRAIHENSAANSAYSSAKYRTCDLARPVLTVTLTNVGNPRLTWTAVDGAVKYRVYRSLDNQTWKLLSTTTDTKLTNIGVAAGTTCYYRILAIAANTAANSAYSVVQAVTVK